MTEAANRSAYASTSTVVLVVVVVVLAVKMAEEESILQGEGTRERINVDSSWALI